MSAKNRLHLSATAIAALALLLPGTALAAPYVPPSNSAATQYTEALPTAGGPKATGGQKSGKQDKPTAVLGHETTKQLESQGAEGRAAADFAAETAPAPVPPAAAASGTPTPGDQSGGAKSGGAKGGGSSGKPQSTGHSGNPASTGNQPRAGAGNTELEEAGNGSSALGQVAGQATGLSSGDLGILLPLLVLASICWGVFFLARHRRRRDLPAS